MDIKEVSQALSYRNEFKIKQSRFWVSVAFYLPEEVAANLPAIESLKVRGQYLIGFNFPPKKDEVFPYEGHLWRATHNPLQFPARYKSQGKKHTPYLMAEYLDSYQDEIEMMFKLIELSTNT
jgi:hypothetical protein